MDGSKSFLSASFIDLLESEGLNDKKIKLNKKKTDETKGSSHSEKKGTEPINSEKTSHKENIFISKNSKEEYGTTITDKLKRTDMNLKREKFPESIPEMKTESHTEVKAADKNSQNSLVFDPKQKTNDPKMEVKSVLKQDSLGQNYKEIVKAAKFHIVENGKNTAEISLQPKDLGKVTLYVSEENNRMEGRITVENESVRQMILGELANLKADLKAGGLDLFEIQVDLHQEMNQPFAQGEGSEKRRSTETYSEYSKGFTSEEDSLESAIEPTSSRLLDLKV
jgi:flagellar hook-length control protein FliK